MNYSYEENFFFRNSDFSYKDEIKPQAILEILEEIAGRHAQKLNIGYKECMEKHFAWVAVRTKVEIIGDFVNGENGYVMTYPSKAKKIDLDRNYVIYNMKHEVIAKAITKWIIMNLDTRRIERTNVIDYPSDAELNGVLESPKKVRIDEGISLDLKNNFKVKLNDLDHNLHVNNARYLEYIFNTFKIDEKRSLKSFECEYLREIKYDEDVCLAYNNERTNFKLYNSNNDVSFIMKVEWK